MPRGNYVRFGQSGGPGRHIPADQFGYSGAATALVPPPSTPAVPPEVFSVTNSNNSGAGSLRQAFIDLRANGGGTITFAVTQVDLDEVLIVADTRSFIVTGGAGVTIHGSITLLGCTQFEFNSVRIYQMWQYNTDPIEMSGCEDGRFANSVLAFGTDQNGNIVGEAFDAGRNKRIQFYRCMNIWPLVKGYSQIAYLTDAFWNTECFFGHANIRPRLARSLTSVQDGNLFFNFGSTNAAPVSISGVTGGGQSPIPVAVDLINNKVQSAGTTHPLVEAANGFSDGQVFESGTVHELLDGTPQATPTPDPAVDHQVASVSGMTNSGDSANVIEANVGCPTSDVIESRAWANQAAGTEERIYFATNKSITSLKYDWRDRSIISGWDPGVIDVRREASGSNLSFKFYLLNIAGGAFTHNVDLRLYARDRRVLWERLGTLEGDDLTTGGSGTRPASGVMQADSVLTWEGEVFPGDPIDNYLQLEMTIDDGGGNDFVYKARNDWQGISL